MHDRAVTVYPLVFPYNDCIAQTNKAVGAVCGVNVPPVLDRSQAGSIAYYKLKKLLGSDKIGDIIFAGKGDKIWKAKAKDSAVNVLDSLFFMKYAGSMIVATPIIDSSRTTYEIKDE